MTYIFFLDFSGTLHTLTNTTHASLTESVSTTLRHVVPIVVTLELWLLTAKIRSTLRAGVIYHRRNSSLLTLEGVSHRVLMSSHVLLEHLVLVSTSEGLAHLLLSSESTLHCVHSWVIRLKSACHISSHISLKTCS